MAMLLFKHQGALSALGRLDHVSAVGYAVSMQHDAAALHLIFSKSKANLAMELQCLGTRRHYRWWLLPLGAAVVCVALAIWRVLTGGRGGGGRDKKHAF
jgi:hypothetical protein